MKEFAGFCFEVGPHTILEKTVGLAGTVKIGPWSVIEDSYIEDAQVARNVTVRRSLVRKRKVAKNLTLFNNFSVKEAQK